MSVILIVIEPDRRIRALVVIFIPLVVLGWEAFFCLTFENTGENQVCNSVDSSCEIRSLFEIRFAIMSGKGN